MFVDALEIHYKDGTVWTEGGDGGEAAVEHTLDDGEFVNAVEQVENGKYLGASMTFFTSRGRELRIEGWQQPGKKWARHRFEAEAEQQISGLAFEGAELVKVEQSPKPQASDNRRPKRMKPAEQYSRW